MMTMLGRHHWIRGDRLADFILRAQEPEKGGIADRPGDIPDPFHTFFGVAGLSLLGRLAKAEHCTTIDPVYAIPRDIVEQMRLPQQILSLSEDGPPETSLRELPTQSETEGCVRKMEELMNEGKPLEPTPDVGGKGEFHIPPYK